MAPKDRERDKQRRDGRKQVASWGGRQSRRGDRRSRSRSRSRSRRRNDKNSPRRREPRHRDPPVTRRVVDKAPEEGELVCDFQPLGNEPPPPGEAHPVVPPSWDNTKHLSEPPGHNRQAFRASWTEAHDGREVTPPPHMDTFGRDEPPVIPPPQPPSQPPPLPKDAPPPLPSEPPPEDYSQLVPPPPPPGDPPACLPQPAAYPASTQLPIPSAAGYDQCGWYGGDHRAYAHPGGYNYPPAQPSFHQQPPQEQHRRWSYHDNRGNDWGHGKHHRQNQQRGFRHHNSGWHQNNHHRYHHHHDFRHDRPRNHYHSFQNRNDDWGGQGGGWPPDYERRTDACMGEAISRVNREIIENGTKWLASRWGVKKERRGEEEEGGETLKSRLADIMLRTMCNENDSDYACSDSEDEYGRRVKPRRLTKRVLSRAWNEIRRRRSSHVEWYNFAKRKGVILKPFPIVPADNTKLPRVVKRQSTKPEKRQARVIPWSIDEKNAGDRPIDPRLVSKTEGQNGAVRPEAPMEAVKRNGGKRDQLVDTQLQIPSLSIIRFLKAADRRHRATYKFQFDSRVHGIRPPNAPRENPEGSNKFNYINSRAEFSSCTYTLARAQGLTTEKLGNGRLMTFPNSIVVRREDNLWLHLRERPYHPLELCDRLKTGRPLFSEGKETDGDKNDEHVKLRLYCNTGADSKLTPILVRLKVCERKSTIAGGLSCSTPKVPSRRHTFPSARSSTPRHAGKKRSLDSADDRRPVHSGKEPTRVHTGTVKEEQKPDLTGVVKTEVKTEQPDDQPHKRKRSRHAEPTQVPTLGASNVLEKTPTSQNSATSMTVGSQEGNLAPGGALKLRLPVVVDVEPGVQHVARVAGTVGMKGVRRVIHTDLSRRLIKSAVQRILSNKEQRAEVAKCAKPKPKPAPRQLPLGVALTVQTKSRGTPVRKPGNIAGPSGGSSGGRGPHTPVRGRGRGGRVAGGRSANAIRGRGRGRGQVAGQARGRGRQAPEKKDQFAVDGASVTEWITSCQFLFRKQH